ncbi:MAG: hypothetical protein QOJ79_1409 [Actinomycetota bacterium]|jgi:hypothetical protein|nr:hypothetical protein [Actinomycetota bacterium]
MTLGFRRAAPAAFLVTGAALLSALSLPALAADAPPPPGLGIRLLEAPTARADDPRAKTYVVDRIAPGATISRAFEITNGDNDAMNVILYTAPAQISGGSFSIRDRGVPGEIVNWTTITPTTVSIAPHSRARARLSVHVDPKAAPGEYYGGIVAERPAARSDKGVVVSLRVAIRMYLSVGPGGEPPSDFTIDTLTAERAPTGEPLVVAQVHNTGGRALDMSGQLRLSKGPGGLSAGPFNATLGTTLGVGQSEPVTVKLDKSLPNGPWLARLDLASGLVKRAATATITFPDTGSGPAVKANLVESKDSSPPWPLIAAGVGGALAVGLILFFFFNGRGRRTDRRGEHQNVTQH